MLSRPQSKSEDGKVGRISGSCQRGLKNLWKMEVTFKLIEVGVLRTDPKRLDELEIRGRTETIQTTALLKPTTTLTFPEG